MGLILLQILLISGEVKKLPINNCCVKSDGMLIKSLKVRMRGEELLMMGSDLKLARVGDSDALRWLARLAAIRFNLLHNIHSFNDSSKNNMTIVQP